MENNCKKNLAKGTFKGGNGNSGCSLTFTRLILVEIVQVEDGVRRIKRGDAKMCSDRDSLTTNNANAASASRCGQVMHQLQTRLYIPSADEHHDDHRSVDNTDGDNGGGGGGGERDSFVRARSRSENPSCAGGGARTRARPVGQRLNLGDDVRCCSSGGRVSRLYMCVCACVFWSQRVCVPLCECVCACVVRRRVACATAAR